MMRLTPLPAGISMRDPAAIIATGFGAGLLKPGPGTWGSLTAVLVGYLAYGVLPLLLAVALVAGYWATARFERLSGSHDLGMIVVDEWAGMFLALFCAAPVWDQVVLAFILFRGFDIAKPWPVGWLDRNLPGAHGVMADDIAAGLLAGILVYGYGLWIAPF